MNFDDLVEGLENVGIEPDLARLYLRLLRNGPSKAGALSDISSFSRTKVYRLLDAMVQEGLADASLGTPTIYRPVPPEDVFDRIRARWRRDGREIEDTRDTMIGALDGLESERPEPDEPSWRIVEGRDRIYEAIAQQVEEAEQSIRMMSTHPVTVTPQPQVRRLWDEAGKRCDAGLHLQAILHLPADRRPWFTKWTQGGPDREVRHIDADHVGHFALFDDETVVTWLVVDSSSRFAAEGDVAIQTDAPEYRTTQSILFDCLWERSVPVGGGVVVPRS